MPREGADRLSEEADRIADDDEEGRLDVLLVLRRAAGRDLGAADLGRDVVDFGRAVVALGLAAVRRAAVAVVPAPAFSAEPIAGLCFAEVLGLAAELRDLVERAAVVPVREAAVRDELREPGLLEVDRVAGRRAALVERRVPPLREVLAAGLADDMVLAAAVSALAAVVMALVAVFIACIADDIVLADAVALVAAAVILLAADVTLVAADDTVLAAVTGVAVVRRAVLRAAVDRDAVERDAVLRVDRDAELRVDLAVPAGFAAVFMAVDVLVLELDFGRLAVPLDALRLADLRAVLAELRRVAARVVD